MISVTSDKIQILVARLTGSRVKVSMSEEESRQISIRLEEPMIHAIEQLTEQTEGFSRNAVITFLLAGGLDLLMHQIQAIEELKEVN